MWNIKIAGLDSSNFERVSAIAIFLFGTVILSTAGILYKASEMEISSTATVFNRFLVGTLVFGALYIGSLVKSKLSSEALVSDRSTQNEGTTTSLKVLLILLLGFTNIVDHLAWSHSFLTTNIAISNILHNLITPFTVLMSWLFFRQKFTERYLLGAAIAMLASIALLTGDLNLGGNSIIGDSEAALSALCTASYLMISEKLKRDFSVIEILFWVCLITSLGTLLPLLLSGQVIFPLSARGWSIVLMLGLGVQVMGWGMLTYSLNFLSSGVVSIYSLLIPAFAYLEAWLLFSENLNWYQGITSVLILVGAYVSLTSESGEQSSLEREIEPSNEKFIRTSHDAGSL